MTSPSMCLFCVEAGNDFMRSEGSLGTVWDRTRQRGYVTSIVAGLLIAAAGLVPWTLLARANARVRPDLPWAAVTTLFYLAAILLWLNGAGPPRRTAGRRRQRLRLWPPATLDAADAEGVPTVVIVALLGFLYLLWIAVGRLSPVPDLSAFPTTAYRWSMLLMGAVTAGVVEESAFRGYMQTGIERFNPRGAIWMTSLMFVASHITQGIGAVVLLGPGLFAASMLYGMLARRTGTILPGIAIHIVGDLAYTYFGLLRGDSRLLFVG